MGIEPMFLLYESSVLPLNYIGETFALLHPAMAGQAELGWRELFYLFLKGAEVVFKMACGGRWAEQEQIFSRKLCVRFKNYFCSFCREPLIGIEPMTSSLPMTCSTN